MSRFRDAATGEDHPEAAKRHFTDGENLYDIGRYANAVYLYGYVIECGLKTALLAYGHPAPWGHNLSELSRQALDIATVLSAPPSLTLATMPTEFLLYKGNNWVDMRYLPDFAVSKSDADSSRALAHQVFSLTITVLDEGGLLV